MSKSVALMLAFATAGLVSACAQPEPEPVMVEPAPVMAEPTYNKF